MFANVCAWARAPYPIGPTYVFVMDVLMGLTQDESASASFGIRRLAAIGAVWRDHLDAVSAQLLVQGIAVVGAVTDPILWLGFDHVEVEAQLH